jgi:hypothetical protein
MLSVTPELTEELQLIGSFRHRLPMFVPRQQCFHVTFTPVQILEECLWAGD